MAGIPLAMIEVQNGGKRGSTWTTALHAACRRLRTIVSCGRMTRKIEWIIEVSPTQHAAAVSIKRRENQTNSVGRFNFVQYFRWGWKVMYCNCNSAASLFDLLLSGCTINFHYLRVVNNLWCEFVTVTPWYPFARCIPHPWWWGCRRGIISISYIMILFSSIPWWVSPPLLWDTVQSNSKYFQITIFVNMHAFRFMLSIHHSEWTEQTIE